MIEGRQKGDLFARMGVLGVEQVVVRVTLDFECEMNGFIGGEVYYMA